MLVTQPSYELAGLGRRSIAALIDFALCVGIGAIALSPIAIALGVMVASDDMQGAAAHNAEALGVLLLVLFPWLWFTNTEMSRWQASVGKKIMGLKVIDEQGQRIGPGKANLRFWMKLPAAAILFWGFIMAAFNDQQQGLHDKVARTLVVKK